MDKKLSNLIFEKTKLNDFIDVIYNYKEDEGLIITQEFRKRIKQETYERKLQCENFKKAVNSLKDSKTSQEILKNFFKYNELNLIEQACIVEQYYKQRF